MSVLLVIAGVLVLLLLGVPVFFALILPSLVYFAVQGPEELTAVIPTTAGGLNSFPLVAVPLFIMMGALANETGVTERLFTAADKFLGHLRGSLGYVNVTVSLGFSWMSGSALADSAALGRIEVPAMLKRGYPSSFATGITAASGIVGPVMPPSIPAVLYAVAAGVSLGGLLIAGILPALLLVLALMLSVFIWARDKHDLVSPKATWSERARAAAGAVPALVAPVLLLGGILVGVRPPPGRPPPLRSAPPPPAGCARPPARRGPAPAPRCRRPRPPPPPPAPPPGGRACPRPPPARRGGSPPGTSSRV